MELSISFFILHLFFNFRIFVIFFGIWFFFKTDFRSIINSKFVLKRVTRLQIGFVLKN